MRITCIFGAISGSRVAAGNSCGSGAKLRRKAAPPGLFSMITWDTQVAFLKEDNNCCNFLQTLKANTGKAAKKTESLFFVNVSFLPI